MPSVPALEPSEPDIAPALAAEHAPVADVGEGIVTATVRTPSGAILGFIYNPHFGAT